MHKYNSTKFNNSEIGAVNAIQKKFVQKQPSRGVLSKRCSENLQQIYRRTPVLKCDLNKVALQLYWNHTSSWVFSCKFAVYFQNTFHEEHLWMAASSFHNKCFHMWLPIKWYHISNFIFDKNFVIFFQWLDLWFSVNFSDFVL